MSKAPKLRAANMDLSMLESIDAKYHSEDVAANLQDVKVDVQPIESTKNVVKTSKEIGETSIFKPLRNRTVYGRRIKVAAHKTTLFDGNPRNFSRNKELDSLIPLIEDTGGNNTPVEARLDTAGQVEIISGSRRRECCLTLGLELLVDLYEDISDEDALELAELENEGRLEIDSISECEYMYYKFNKLLEKNVALSQEVFANMHKKSRTVISEMFTVAKLPDFLKSSSKQMTWNQKQLRKLCAIGKKLESMNINSADQLNIKLPQLNPNLAINALTEACGLSVSKRDSEDKPYSLKKNRDGSQTIKLNREITEENMDKLLKLIEEFYEM